MYDNAPNTGFERPSPGVGTRPSTTRPDVYDRAPSTGVDRPSPGVGTRPSSSGGATTRPDMYDRAPSTGVDRPSPGVSTRPDGVRPGGAGTAVRPGVADLRGPDTGVRPSYERATHATRPPGTLVRPDAITRPSVRPGDGYPDRPGQGSVRPGSTRPGTYVPPHRTTDHRYARPDWRSVRYAPSARYQPPSAYYYRPYYTRWYCHPYYRWQYSTTVIVSFDYRVDPWTYAWIPPSRNGWTWVPGAYTWGYYTPGYWRPVVAAPRYDYVYVPGWWVGTRYVEGYYRPQGRRDGDWTWVDGYYLQDGTYIWGYWMPTRPGPEGYLWEPGFYDGETYVDGFWRPQFRRGFAWVSAYYDEDGVFRGGYWMPTDNQPGYTWVPGWFDGNAWVEGYWVRDEEFQRADVEGWAPPTGWNDGWEVGAGWGDGEVVSNRTPGSNTSDVDDFPLALPAAPQ